MAFPSSTECLSNLIEETRTIVLASWRPAEHLCGLLDEASRKKRRTFIPVILESNSLTIGPVARIAGGGCWECWTKRARQLESRPEEYISLLQYYDKHSAVGPQGYLPSTALAGAALVAEIINKLDCGEQLKYDVWQLDILTQEVATMQVTSSHGCERCGSHRSEDTRTVLEIREALTYLW